MHLNSSSIGQHIGKALHGIGILLSSFWRPWGGRLCNRRRSRRCATKQGNRLVGRHAGPDELCQPIHHDELHRASNSTSIKGCTLSVRQLNLAIHATRDLQHKRSRKSWSMPCRWLRSGWHCSSPHSEQASCRSLPPSDRCYRLVEAIAGVFLYPSGIRLLPRESILNRPFRRLNWAEPQEANS